MLHQSVKPDLEDSMPRHTYLMRRNSRYYLNVKAPKDLPEVMGRELIRKSLDTSDPREAARRVRFESSKLDALFDVERRKLEAEATWKVPAVKRMEMSDREVHQLVCSFFVGLERSPIRGGRIKATNGGTRTLKTPWIHSRPIGP